MKILIAGGAGYIGTKLSAFLVERGFDVTVMDDLWFGNYLPASIPLIKKDIFNCKQEDLEGFDQLIFLAGLSNDPMAEYSPSLNFIYNAALPSYLGFIAKKAGIRRFIYGSSCSIYGNKVNRSNDEDNLVSCEFPYAISKFQGEQGIHVLRDETFSVISLRQGTVCGHSNRMRFDLVVNTMFKSAMTEGRITVHNPDIWRPILDINDALTGYLLAIKADHFTSGVFNIATGNFTIGEVGNKVKKEIEKLTGEKMGLQIDNVKNSRNYKVSLEKIQRDLGYRSQHTIEDIVKDLHRNFDQYGDLNQERYYNIQVFKKRKYLESLI